MIQNTNQAKAGGIPRLALINSFAGFGRCSTTVALPVISMMKVQACPVPTSVLSNHLGFPVCHFDDYTGQMQEYLHAWEQLGATFDGLYCGFLGSVEQIEIVRDFLRSPMMKAENAQPLFLLDPVMGDNGKAYSTITSEHCEKLKELAALADILTPNITEACLLTDTPYKEGRFADYELTAICRKLASRHAQATGKDGQRIVITGLLDHKRFLNYVWENGKRSVYSTEIVGKSWHGTGDIFASILAAGALHEVGLMQSVQKAADFISLCIRGSEEAGVPEKDGVLIEKYLSKLADM